MVGALERLSGILKTEAVKESEKERVTKSFTELNIKAI